MKPAKAKWMVCVSMVIFGTIGLFVRHIGLPSAELALYRAVMATLLVGLFLLLTRQPISFRQIGKALPLLLLSGAALGFNWILLFEAYRYTTVSVATLSYYFAPVLVTLACPLLFKEKMTPKQWLCFGMSTLGILLLTGTEDLSAGSNHLLGIAFGLGAACLYATVVLLNKKLQAVTGLHRTFFQFVAASAVLLPYVLLTGGFHLHTVESSGLFYLGAVGIFHSCLAYCLYFSSIKYLPGQQVALFSYIDPLVAVLLSVTVLGESVSPWQCAGGALILGFTLYSELSVKK